MGSNRYYIYLHTDSNNSPFYIGKGSLDRCHSKSNRSPEWRAHIKDNHFNTVLLEFSYSEEAAYELEKFYVNKYGRKDLGKGSLVNRTDGGKGGNGYIHSKDARSKISKGLKGRPSPRRGEVLSDYTKELMTNNNGMNKLILDFVSGVYYQSVSEAARVLGINRRTLGAKLSGQNSNNTNLKYV